MKEASVTQTSSSAPICLPPSSLIICSRNRPKFLSDCVQSVLEGDVVPSELVLIDQSDHSDPILKNLKTSRPCEIRYLWTQSVGLGRARNAGIAAARHDILVFTDDDVAVPATWFATLVRGLVNAGQRAIVTGRVLPSAPEMPGGFAPSTKIDVAPAIYEGRVGIDVLWGNNMAMCCSAVRNVGGFDERLGAGSQFPASEDNDFGFRLLEAGYRIIYIPEAVLYHRAWRNERHFLALRWNYGRGQGAFYAKHLSVTDRYMLWRLMKTIKRHVSGFALRLRRQRRLAYGDAVYILGLLSGAAHWILTQRRTR